MIRIAVVAAVAVLALPEMSFAQADSVAVYIAPVVWKVDGFPNERVPQREYARDALQKLIAEQCGPCTYPAIDDAARLQVITGTAAGTSAVGVSEDSIRAVVHRAVRAQIDPRHRLVIFDLEVGQTSGSDELRVELNAYDRSKYPEVTGYRTIASLQTPQRAVESLREFVAEHIRRPGMDQFRSPPVLAPLPGPVQAQVPASVSPRPAVSPRWALRVAAQGIPQSGALAGQRELGREYLRFEEFGAAAGIELNPRGMIGAALTVGYGEGRMFTSGTESTPGEGARQTRAKGIGHLQGAAEVFLRPFPEFRLRPVVGAGLAAHRYSGSGPFPVDRFGTETVQAEFRPQTAFGYSGTAGAGLRFSNGAELALLTRLEWLSGLSVEIAGETSSPGRVSSHGILTSLSVPLR